MLFEFIDRNLKTSVNGDLSRHSDLLLVGANDPPIIQFFFLLSSDIAILKYRSVFFLVLDVLVLNATAGPGRDVPTLIGGSRIDANITIINRLIDRVTLLFRCKKWPIPTL